MDKLMSQYLSEIKRVMPDLAEEAMLFPRADPFEHGVQVGKWQGLHKALEVLEDLVNDSANTERDS